VLFADVIPPLVSRELAAAAQAQLTRN
jgi:hypothetical protein